MIANRGDVDVPLPPDEFDVMPPVDGVEAPAGVAAAAGVVAKGATVG